MSSKFSNLSAVFSFLGASLVLLFIIFQSKIIQPVNQDVSVSEILPVFTAPTQPIVLADNNKFQTKMEFTNSTSKVLYLIACFDGITGDLPLNSNIDLVNFENAVSASSFNLNIDNNSTVLIPRRPNDQFAAFGPSINISPKYRLVPGSRFMATVDYTVKQNPSPTKFNLTFVCGFTDNVFAPGNASDFTSGVAREISIDTNTFTHTDGIPEINPYENIVENDSFTIQAENFDTGGPGVSYFDTTPTNRGGVYRPNEQVDIRSIGDGEYATYQMDHFEYLRYTIDVPQTGTYEIRQRISTQLIGNGYTLKVNGENKSSYSFGSTGSWDRFFELYGGTIELQKGISVFEIYIDKGFVDFDYIKFTRNDDLCGNFVTQNSEQCDDGNSINGDGCSASCLKENSNGSIDCGNMDDNDDGIINVQDTPSFVRLIGQSCAVDESTVNACGSRDTNRSGDIDSVDFAEYVKLFGNSCTP